MSVGPSLITDNFDSSVHFNSAFPLATGDDLLFHVIGDTESPVPILFLAGFGLILGSVEIGAAG